MLYTHHVSKTGSSRFAQDDGYLYRHSEERSDVRIQKNSYSDLSRVYEEVMTLLATLRTPIDAFFDTVTVNVEDANLKENRYALLGNFISLVNQIADFSKLQG